MPVELIEKIVLVRVVYVFYNIISNGVISMIHVHKIMRIAPPPETDLNVLIYFVVGVVLCGLLNEWSGDFFG